MSSADLTPGTRVRHRASGSISVLTRRKEKSEHKTPSMPLWPGWWVDNGDGLADFVLDGDEWEVVGGDNDA